MAGSTKVFYEIHGFDAMEKALKELRAKMGGKEGNITAQSLWTATLPVVRQAQANAPIGKSGAYSQIRRTKSGYKKVADMGTLRKSIVRKRHPNPSGWSELVGVGVFIPKGTTRENPLGAWYAHFVEFGTRNPNYPKQPFLRPALESTRAQFIQVFGNQMGKRIEKEGRRIGQKYDYGSRRTKV